MTEGKRSIASRFGERTLARGNPRGMKVALILIALAACKQAKEPAKAAEILAKSRALSAQICECKDRTCAAPLMKQWNGLAEMLHGADFSDEQVEGLTTEDERVTKCVEALPN